MMKTTHLFGTVIGCGVGVLLGIALQPRPALAKTITMTGVIESLKEKSGDYPMTFEFKVRGSSHPSKSIKGIAHVDHGTYLVDLPTDGLNTGDLYAVKVAEAPSAPIAYVSLQPSFPGASDIGHVNISGSFKADKIRIGTIASGGARINVIDSTSAGGVNVSSNGMAVTAISTSGNATIGVINNGTGDGIDVTASGTGSDGLYVHSASATNRTVIEANNTAAGDIRVMSIDAAGATGRSYTGQFINRSDQGIAVYADTYDVGTKQTYGVFSEHRGKVGIAVFGRMAANSTGTAIYGDAGPGSTGYALYGIGKMAVTGTKSFQIDHPLYPTTQYLNHYCPEAPEPYNMYRGSVTLDATGSAWAQLPSYYGEINKDETYMLTPVGSAMPNLHVQSRVIANKFQISGGVAGSRVDWVVTAVRNDRWIQANGFQTEQPKPAEVLGTYLQPELFGKSQALSQQSVEREPLRGVRTK